MAEQLSSTTTSSVHLIGSQLETYQTLIAMGFASSEALNVAEIFGSNVQGAVDCLFNGGPPTMQSPSSDTILSSLLKLHPKPKINKRLLDEILPFRTTSLSLQLTAGYIREQQIDYFVPSVISNLIIQYSNLYFIKLNYNIHDDIDEKEEKCPKDTSIWMTSSDTTLKDIAIAIEKSAAYSYKDVMDVEESFDVEQNAYFVHLWLRFRFLKPIYPMENGKIRIDIHDINTCEYGNTSNRWVEIPNDFEQIKISEMDKLFAATAKDKHAFLELGIEKFNQKTKKWPFRNPQIVPLSHEIVRSVNTKEKLQDNKWKCVHCAKRNDNTYVFCAGCYQDRPQQHENDAAATDAEAQPMTVEYIVAKAIRKYNRKFDQFRAIRDDLSQYFPNDPRAAGLAIEFLNGTRDVNEVQVLPLLSVSDTEATYASPIASPRAVSNKSPPPPPSTTHDTIPLFVPAGAVKAIDSWRKHLAIGDIIDVKDEQDKWYEAVIRCIKSNGKETLLYLHYIGWNTRWDESILAEKTTHIAKRGTYTLGPFRPKRSLNSNTPSLVYPYYRKYIDGSEILK